MSSSGDDDDFYGNAVKKLAKFSDIESNNDSDDEITATKPIEVIVKNKPVRKPRKSVDKPVSEAKEIEQPKTPLRRSTRRSKTSSEILVEDTVEKPVRRTRRATKQAKSPKAKKKKSPAKRKRKQNGNSTIVVLSDTEDPQTNIEQAVSDVNAEYTIQIWWQFRELKRFNIRKYQKFTSIFDYYSEREQLPQNRLLFIKNNKTIYPDDTPDSLNFETIETIEGGYIGKGNSIDLVRNNKESQSSTMVQLKVQLSDRKKPLIVAVKKTDPLSVLMAKCSEELETEIKNLKFRFDGDLLNPNDTPESLEFEGGECIDVTVC